MLNNLINSNINNNDPVDCNVDENGDFVSDNNRIPGDSDSMRGKLVKGPEGIAFAVDYAILPSIIEILWNERDRAKEIGNAALSLSVKLIMNSFYGVLGSPGCRFYDPRIAGSITLTGQWILNYTSEYIESLDYKVIYGDTDSLFVCLTGKDIEEVKQNGENLRHELNRHLNEVLKRKFNVNSILDIELKDCSSFFYAHNSGCG